MVPLPRARCHHQREGVHRATCAGGVGCAVVGHAHGPSRCPQAHHHSEVSSCWCFLSACLSSLSSRLVSEPVPYLVPGQCAACAAPTVSVGLVGLTVGRFPIVPIVMVCAWFRPSAMRCRARISCMMRRCSSGWHAGQHPLGESVPSTPRFSHLDPTLAGVHDRVPACWPEQCQPARPLFPALLLLLKYHHLHPTTTGGVPAMKEECPSSSTQRKTKEPQPHTSEHIGSRATTAAGHWKRCPRRQGAPRGR